MTSLALLYKNTDGAKWGDGKESALTSLEVDNNMWSIQQAVNNLINNPPSAVEISNIQVQGSQVIFHMSDGSAFGPFSLPVAAMTYRPEGFVTGQLYRELDFLPVAGRGLYLVRHTFTAESPHDTFDPDDVDDNGDPLYQLVFSEDVVTIDLSFNAPGLPGDGLSVDDDIFQHMFLRDVYFPADFAGSVAKLMVAPTDDLVFNIMKDEVEQGTLTFTEGETDGVFDLDGDATQYTNGTKLGLRKTTATDATAKGLCIGFSAIRGLIPG